MDLLMANPYFEITFWQLNYLAFLCSRDLKCGLSGLMPTNRACNQRFFHAEDACHFVLNWRFYSSTENSNSCPKFRHGIRNINPYLYLWCSPFCYFRHCRICSYKFLSLFYIYFYFLAADCRKSSDPLLISPLILLSILTLPKLLSWAREYSLGNCLQLKIRLFFFNIRIYYQLRRNSNFFCGYYFSPTVLSQCCKPFCIFDKFVSLKVTQNRTESHKVKNTQI